MRITNIGRFAAIEEEREPFKQLTGEICSLEEGTIETKVILSDFVTAWTSAKGRAATEVQRKAEAASSSGTHPAPIPKRTYTAMANAFREEFGKHPDNELPGQPLMDKTSAMAEDNDPVAVQLVEVASLEDGEDEVVYAECDLNGALKRQQRKTKQKGPSAVKPRGVTCLLHCPREFVPVSQV